MKSLHTTLISLPLCCCLVAVGCSETPFEEGSGDVSLLTDGPATPDTNNGLPDGYGPLHDCKEVGKSCNAHDPCAINPICGKDKKCWPQAVMNCSDGLACTLDTCLGSGMCQNTPNKGYCRLAVMVYGKQTCKDLKLDGGSTTGSGADAGTGKTILCCFKEGDRKPGDQCRICQPKQSTPGEDGGATGDSTKWSPANGGYCDDGNACTKGDYCQSGQCKGSFYSTCTDKYSCTNDVCDGKGGCLGNPLKKDWCLINGACYKDGTANPTGACSGCDVKSSQSAWTTFTNTCMIDSKCYGKGIKHPGGCAECAPSVSATKWTVTGSYCYISKACKKPGDKDTTGCSSCQPAVDKYAWSPMAGMCKIDGKCYSKGQKNTGGCAECDPAVSATKWTVKGSYCYISKACKKPGDKDTTGCATCDPAKDKYGWTPLAGMCKIDNKCYAKGTKHPKGCAECIPATSATKWTLTSKTHCLIEGECYTANQTVGCFKCDPTKSQTAWSKVAGCTHMDLNIGTHKTTYSGNTRGYWFTAPVAFTIIGVRVPIDVGTAAQNVEVVRFTSAVTKYPTQSTNFVSLHYSKGVAGTNWINVKIPVKKGDIIGLLGARGTSSMKNSYGNGNPYKTTIANQPVSLTRLVLQANLYSAKATKLSTESGGSYSRVEMRYVP